MRRMGILLALALYGCGSTAPVTTTQPEESALHTLITQQTPTEIRLSASGATVTAGNPEAPVTLTVFTNFSCAYCRDFHLLLQSVATAWMEQGLLRLEIVPVALQKYPESESDARTLLCLANERQGLALLGMLYDTSMNASARAEALEAMEVDTNTLNDCMQKGMPPLSPALQDAVTEGGILLPRYILNNQRYTGLPEAADLRGQIQAAFESAGGSVR